MITESSNEQVEDGKTYFHMQKENKSKYKSIRVRERTYASERREEKKTMSERTKSKLANLHQRGFGNAFIKDFHLHVYSMFAALIINKKYIEMFS